jgi:hypothetical protein
MDQRSTDGQLASSTLVDLDVSAFIANEVSFSTGSTNTVNRKRVESCKDK